MISTAFYTIKLQTTQSFKANRILHVATDRGSVNLLSRISTCFLKHSLGQTPRRHSPQHHCERRRRSSFRSEQTSQSQWTCTNLPVDGDGRFGSFSSQHWTMVPGTRVMPLSESCHVWSNGTDGAWRLWSGWAISNVTFVLSISSGGCGPLSLTSALLLVAAGSVAKSSPERINCDEWTPLVVPGTTPGSTPVLTYGCRNRALVSQQLDARPLIVIKVHLLDDHISQQVNCWIHCCINKMTAGTSQIIFPVTAMD